LIAHADLTWSSGGAAEIVALTAKAMTVRSETPHPPGARIEAATADGALLKMKVHGGKREADGAYRIEGRPIDLGRELREKLVATLATRA
jgi:hypothetical protein